MKLATVNCEGSVISDFFGPIPTQLTIHADQPEGTISRNLYGQFDVGAKSEIYSVIYELAERGVGVVIVFSELPEVMGACDRIIVMRQRRFVADVSRQDATAEKILSLALPIAPVTAPAVSPSDL